MDFVAALVHGQIVSRFFSSGSAMVVPIMLSSVHYFSTIYCSHHFFHLSEVSESSSFTVLSLFCFHFVFHLSEVSEWQTYKNKDFNL